MNGHDMTAPHPIADIMHSIKDRSVMSAFFREIFTPAERKDLTLRWRLMEMLHRNVSQRTIARKLSVSLCKITRGSRILKQKNSVSRKLLDRMEPAPAGPLWRGRRRKPDDTHIRKP